MKRYAVLSDDKVVNVIIGRPSENDGLYPNIRTDLPVGIGDTFIDGTFFRDGKQLYTPLEEREAEITTLAKAGAAQVQAYCTDTGNAPKEDSGIFVMGVDPWEAGKTYAANDLFSYNGAMGFVKQAHTSQETWLPFTVGTESLYGARPAPDADGVYPWAYNMAASVGMQVKDPDDGLVYTCIQAIATMLYKPHEIPAHFEQA